MLNGLHKPNWSKIKITDAYYASTAEDVPTLIENIVAAIDENEQAKWYHQLDRYLFDHDWASLAAPLIVPYLIEFLKMDHVQIKNLVMYQLAELRLSSRNYRFLKKKSQPYEAQIAQIKTHEVIIDNLTLFLSLLDDTNYLIRHAAMAMLSDGFHAKDTPTIIDHFTRRSQVEKNIRIRYDIYQHLGNLLRENREILGDKFQQTIGWMEQQCTSKKPFPLTIAIDHGLVAALRDETPAVVLNRLSQVLLHTEAIQNQLARTDKLAEFNFYGEDFLYRHTMYYVKWISDDRILMLWRSLLGQVDTPKQARKLANSLLRYYFIEGVLATPEEELLIENGKLFARYEGQRRLYPPKELKPIQRQVVKMFVEADRVWQESHNLLEAYGLPAFREDARKLIE